MYIVESIQKQEKRARPAPRLAGSLTIDANTFQTGDGVFGRDPVPPFFLYASDVRVRLSLRVLVRGLLLPRLAFHLDA
ncbi:MAG: hypothetical protein QOH06_4224 [Acidobacteriota bacterium]|jgi:hypothetical protein|nr:hypothetical protein [Acidobacteriota bacterium]